MAKVTGIGGVFFKSPDADGLNAWYQQHLGIPVTQYGTMFEWREVDQPERKGQTVWSVFKHDSNYFAPSQASFMVNYRVDDLDALLAQLKTAGVRIDPKREDHDYGRFAWIYDPDGNKIELWQPPATPPAT